MFLAASFAIETRLSFFLPRSRGRAPAGKVRAGGGTGSTREGHLEHARNQFASGTFGACCGRLRETFLPRNFRHEFLLRSCRSSPCACGFTGTLLIVAETDRTLEDTSRRTTHPGTSETCQPGPALTALAIATGTSVELPGTLLSLQRSFVKWQTHSSEQAA